jgi:hypothetical protein
VSVSLNGYTVFALDPVARTLEQVARLSREDAWAMVSALAPAPPLLIHRQPGAALVGGRGRGSARGSGGGACVRPLGAAP